jgi:two-component system sensor histidine kinase KdpD
MGNLTAAQSEMVQLIDEQSAVLDELTTRLLKTARLEVYDLTPHKQMVDVRLLIEDVVDGCRAALGNTPIRVCVPRDLSISCDRDLVAALLTQYVDNAGKYSTGGLPITVWVAERPGEIVFSVHNVGPVIQPVDRERVFDRYFRCVESAANVSGTGIGLSIAKRVAQAHGGDVWLTSDHENGTTFFASLQTPPKEERSR